MSSLKYDMQIICTVSNVTFKISSQTLDIYQSSYLFFGYERKYIETSPKWNLEIAKTCL